MDSVKYNAALAMRGTSREKLYQEFGLESLRKRDGTENFATFPKCLKVNPGLSF